MCKKLFMAMVIACLVFVPFAVFAEGTTSTTTTSTHDEVTNAHSTQVIDVFYTRDTATGQLIGQRQTIHEEGVDIDGVPYVSDTVVEYQIFQGEGKIMTSTTTSTTTKEDGSTETSTTTTSYAGCYDAGGRLVKAPTGTRTVIGNTAEYEDDKGNIQPAEEYTGSYTMSYTIIAGSAYVSEMSGSTTYDTIDEATGEYVENRTTESTVTYEYTQINGDVLTKSTTATSKTTQVQTDDAGKNLWTSSTIKTTYEYDQTTGALISAAGTGTGSGYQLTSAGYQTYTSDITVTYEVINGLALQTQYHEVRTYDTVEKPDDVTPQTQPVDPAVQGEVQNAWVVSSTPNNVGQRNYAVYILVDAEAFDKTKGDGKFVEMDGEDYLIRIDCGTDSARASSLATEYVGKVGTVMQFFGYERPGRIIDFLGTGAGGFDLPKL